VRIIAHRTLPLDAPENSLAGIAAAARQGADLVEIDVRLTRDGVPVLCHDPIPLRTLRWPVPVRFTSERCFGRLRAFDGPGGGEGHRRAAPPTLAAAAEALPPHLGFAVDFKDGRAVGVSVDVLAALGVLDRSLLWTRDQRSTEFAVRGGHGAERALLAPASTPAAVYDYLHRAAAWGVEAVSIDDRVTDPVVVASAHELGLVVYCWVRSEDGHEAAAATGVDGIVTDWVGAARRARGDASPSGGA